MPKGEKITVGDLRRHLAEYPDHFDLQFGPDEELTFYRLKQRGDTLVQLEFNELFEIEKP